MSKSKDADYPHIDFENKIVYGVLKQIKHKDIHKPNDKCPNLVNVWSCKISPKQSKSFIQLIRDVITPYDPQPFTHMKRLQKSTTDQGIILNGLLCSKSMFADKKQVIELIKEYGSNDLSSISENDLNLVSIPSNLPATKEITDEWSEIYWPMSWKGNQDIQFLKGLSINIKKERSIVKDLLRGLESHAEYKTFNGIPVGTLIVDSKNNEYNTLVTSFDCRDQHPLHHSIMKGIQQIADNEKSKRLLVGLLVTGNNNYLLNDLTIYTTHEPCVMCSMALVHSRIDKIVYLKPMSTGGLESNYQLGDRDGLNWKFEIWRWLDPDDLKWLEDIENDYASNDNLFNA